MYNKIQFEEIRGKKGLLRLDKKNEHQRQYIIIVSVESLLHCTKTSKL